MQSMSDSNYQWYKKFSKRELRALLIQQCYDPEYPKRHISLQDYVHEHAVAKKEYKLIADNLFSNDSETIQDHPYETHKNGPQYMTPKYMQYRTPNEHFHTYGGAPHAGGGAPPYAGGGALHTAPHTETHRDISHIPTMPVTDRTGLPQPRSSGGKKGQTPALLTGGSELKGASSYAHDDFGDEVPDDYRV